MHNHSKIRGLVKMFVNDFTLLRIKTSIKWRFAIKQVTYLNTLIIAEMLLSLANQTMSPINCTLT